MSAFCTVIVVLYSTNFGLITVLHPGLKTQYFRDQDWPEEWIMAAVELTRDEWTTYYKPAAPAPDPPAVNPNPPAANAPASHNGTGRCSAQRVSQLVHSYLTMPLRSQYADCLRSL